MNRRVGRLWPAQRMLINNTTAAPRERQEFALAGSPQARRISSHPTAASEMSAAAAAAAARRSAESSYIGPHSSAVSLTCAIA